MHRVGLWLRWSLRDLRRRWAVVGALALVIAIGTGAAAAFSSVSTWRHLSNDASYRMLAMHDLSVSFGDNRADAGTALAAVRAIPHAGWLNQVESRLDVPTQVEIVSAGRRLVVAGRLVGMPTSGGAPLVDRVAVTSGRMLSAADEQASVAVLEKAFAERYSLPTTGTVRVAGGTEVSYVGRGRSPVYLLNGTGGWFGEANRAVLFAPLPITQRLTGAPGQINQLAITLRPGADVATVRQEVSQALARSLPSVPATLGDRRDDAAYRMLYDDIQGDQQMFDFIAILVLGGAALATFNLATRVVAAQRREIGVGMALGVRAWTLGIRPLMFGVQVAVLGAVLGLGVGYLLGDGIISIMARMIPLPVWRTPTQPDAFVRAALLGIAVPLLGIVIPVLRAVRVQPAEAIRTAHIVGRGGRLARLLGRIPLPGSSIRHLPIRHVLRAPGRTLLTGAGIGAAVAVLVAMLGLLDSFGVTLDRGERELNRGLPGRTIISLDTFYPVDAPQVAGIGTVPEVERAQPGLRMPVTAFGARTAAGTKVDLVIDVIDFRTAIWTPTLDDQVGSGPPRGLVLAAKAAKDLGVRPGDTVRVEHPRRTSSTGFETVTSTVTVSAVHPHPMRPLAYLDAGQADLFGLAGVANQVQVLPRSGVDDAALRQALLDNRAIAAVQPVTAASRAVKDAVAEFVDMLRLVEGFVLALVLLIAFNAASISADERVREHATIFAFGLRPGTVLRNAMTESLLIGALGTAVGIAGGLAAAGWEVSRVVKTTLPDMDVALGVRSGSLLLALVLGVVAVAVAPLLTSRRLYRMEVPAALRVVE